MLSWECDACGARKEKRENIAGATKLLCPNCDEDWREPIRREKYHCRGCWEIKSCLCHHISYDPERVVPMCQECHERLHRDPAFLPHLIPEMRRSKAEERGLISKLGLSDTEYEPIAIEYRDRN